MRFSALLDIARNRRCQPICFVSSTVSNNFSSACYSCREYQRATTRFVTWYFVGQITSRMRSGCFRGTEASRLRHTHLPCRQALGVPIWEKMNTRPPPQCSLKAVQIGRPPCGGIRVAFVNQSPSKEKSLHEVSSRTERSTWSRHPIRLLFLPGITRGREVVGHGD